MAAYLEARGAVILERRWRCRYGELDLIAEHVGTLCLIEVKLRKNDRYAAAREFVTPAKQKKLRLTAEHYLMEHASDLQPRFDVAEIYAPQGTETKRPRIIYWENAFY